MCFIFYYSDIKSLRLTRCGIQYRKLPIPVLQAFLARWISLVKRLLPSSCPLVHLPIRLSACISAAPLDRLHWNFWLVTSLKCIEKIQVALKSGKNIGHFTFLLLPATLNAHKMWLCPCYRVFYSNSSGLRKRRCLTCGQHRIRKSLV